MHINAGHCFAINFQNLLCYQTIKNIYGILLQYKLLKKELIIFI